jgi:hypothetical protein
LLGEKGSDNLGQGVAHVTATSNVPAGGVSVAAYLSGCEA